MRVWMGGIGLLTVASWGMDAAAQDGPATDLHGLTPPAIGRESAAPITVMSAPRWAQGSYRVGLLGEFAAQPLTLYEDDGFGVTATPLIRSIVGANASGAYAFSRRFGIEAALPVLVVSNQVGSALAPGDLRVSFPIGLVIPRDEGGPGLAIGVAPWAVVPTGSRADSIGSGGGGGGSMMAGWRTERLSVDVAAGAGWTPKVPFFEQTLGGVQAPFGGGLAVRPVGRTWVGAEVRGQADPGSSSAASGRLGPTAEALLTVRTQGGPAWFGTGAGTALTQGPGSSAFRAFAGVSVGDERMRRNESALPPVEIIVTDADSMPIPDAEVLSDGVVIGVTNSNGAIELAQELLWPAVVSVRAVDHATVEVAKPDVVGLPVRVMLMTVASVVPSRVSDLQGNPTQGTWVARALDGQEVVRGAMGEMELPPGSWSVTFQAPGLASQVRVVDVVAGRAAEPVEVVLAPPAGDRDLVLHIVDVDGNAVSGARVLIDGAPVGLTSAGGPLTLTGLVSGETTVTVRRPGYNTIEATIEEDGQSASIVLVRTPGSVKVVVVDSEGSPVGDAVVRFLGPSRLAPATVGPSGERVQVLGAGKWSVLVSSPSYGAQARDIEIAEDAYGMEVVDVVLRPDEGGGVDLRVSVVDQDGLPVEGVGVSLADKPVGSTGSGGMVRLTGLAPGVRDLTVIGDLLRGVKPVPLELFEGLQDVVVPVRWVPGAVQVRVVGPDGPAEDARVRFMGSDVRSFEVDEDGMLRTSLPAGDWSVLVSSPTLGVQQRALLIAKDSEILHRVEVSLRPPEGGLADLSVRLVDPEGSPVSGATVSLDGYSVGKSGPDGGLVVEGLAVGPRDLLIEAGLYARVDKPIRLLEGQQEVEEVLEWAEGAVRVLALSGGKPVPDALVRLLGPSAIPSGPVDAEGTRTVALSSGRWQALVSSPVAGVAQQGFVVPAGATDRIDVEVNLRVTEKQNVQLVLRVVDSEGVPVPGAAVRLGGEKVGMTGDGGVLLVNDGLSTGNMVLMVEHPTHNRVSMPIDVGAGSSERVVEMAWVEQPVAVALVDEEGQPTAGEVVWRGPSDVPVTLVDPTGKASVMLRPGNWQAVASGPSGLGRGAFVVEGAPVALKVEVGASSLDPTASSIAILGSVLFDVNASQLRSSGDKVLDQVATELLRSEALVRVEVQGHTDSTGAPASNQALSEARAESVLEALVARGVPRELLESRGYGPQRPVADNGSDEGRQKNRRVQFEVLEGADQ